MTDLVAELMPGQTVCQLMEQLPEVRAKAVEGLGMITVVSQLEDETALGGYHCFDLITDKGDRLQWFVLPGCTMQETGDIAVLTSFAEGSRQAVDPNQVWKRMMIERGHFGYMPFAEAEDIENLQSYLQALLNNKT